jgi:hypothetical protein
LWPGTCSYATQISLEGLHSAGASLDGDEDEPFTPTVAFDCTGAFVSDAMQRSS